MRPQAVALTIAAGAASAVAAALVLLKRLRGSGAPPALLRLKRSRGSGAPPGLLRLKRWRRSGAPAAAPETYRCACGEEFRVAGTGRHRVYWRAGAPDGEPLLEARCPSCDRPLGPDREAAVHAAR
jgi:hypothetical protein